MPLDVADVDRCSDLSGTLGRAEEFRGSSPGLVFRNELDADCRFTGCCPDLITGSRPAVRRSVSDFRATPVLCESVGLATMLRVGFDRNTELRVELDRNTELRVELEPDTVLRVGLDRKVELGVEERDIDDRLRELVLDEDEELGVRMIVEDREGTVLRRVIDGLLELRVVVGTDRWPVTIRLPIELRLELDDVDGLRCGTTDRVIGEELGRRIWLEDLLRKDDVGCRLTLVGGREELSERDVLVERDCKDCL